MLLLQKRQLFVPSRQPGQNTSGLLWRGTNTYSSLFTHPKTKFDLYALVADTNVSITLFRTIPTSAPENKLSFSFDQACSCRMFPYIAFETASSLASTLQSSYEKSAVHGEQQIQSPERSFVQLYQFVLALKLGVANLVGLLVQMRRRGSKVGVVSIICVSFNAGN